MDSVASAANEVVRQSIHVAQAAADELAKSATTVAQSVAQAKDPIGWLAGEASDGDSGGEDQFRSAVQPLVPVPLAALPAPWGACFPPLHAPAPVPPVLLRLPTPGFTPGSPGDDDDEDFVRLQRRLAADQGPGTHMSGSRSSAAGIFADDDDEFLGFGAGYTDVEPRYHEPAESYFEHSAVVGETRSIEKEHVVQPRHFQPFLPDAELNGKLVLWQGDVCSLEVDALLAPAATGYSAGSSTIFSVVLQHGGKDLRKDLRRLDPCKSGEARLTKAYGLPCHKLLLTVGPKYKEKYRTAAQNTLNSCYRECFQQLVEAELRSIAIPCSWYHTGYPPEEQAHVALRSVRKCMEHLRRGIDSVVLAASGEEEITLYDSLLPLYFPRTEAEARQGVQHLPMQEACLSPWGEVAVEERRIRVASRPVVSSFRGDSDEDSDTDAEPLFSPASDADKAFLDARGDTDEKAMKRLECTMVEAETADLARQACLRYLRRARELQAEPASSRFVFRAGRDRFTRSVVVLLGARLPSLGVRDERTVPLFVKELELLRGERFLLLYVNSCVPAFDSTRLEVLQEMVAVMGAKYRNSLDQILVLHPGLWFRAAFAVGSVLCDEAANVWHNSVYAQSLNELSAWVGTEQLQELPEYVRACDTAAS